MPTLWVIERAKPHSLALRLMGDFAVRAFGGLPSFERLCKMKSGADPAAVIVDADESHPALASATIRRMLGDVPVVFLGQSLRQGASKNAVESILSKDIDSLDLVRYVKAALRKRRNEHESIVGYKDVQLDSEKLLLIFSHCDENENLTLKEARLLRAFLEHPGACLTRLEIIKQVWDGTKVSPRTIDSHVSRLRMRLQNSEVNIETVYGGGYLLK